jgi:hypothetical protein
MPIDSLDGIDIGDTFTHDGADKWTVESYCQFPTLTLVNKETGEKITAAVGSGLMREFQPCRKSKKSDD